MDFTPRMQQILRHLLKATDYVKEQDLADSLGISKRTVQRELDGTDKALAALGLTLERKKKAGLKLSGTADAKEKLAASLSNTTAVDFTDKQQRRRYLLFALLRDRTPKKLFYYSQLLGVSEATAASDLEALAPWLQKNNLSVLKKQGYGVLLRGTEKDYREAMRRFISETTDASDFKEMHDAHEALAKAVMNVTDKGIYQLLNSHTIQRVYAVLQSLDEEKIAQFTDTAKIGLVIHIAIAVERVASGEVTASSSAETMLLRHDDDYQLACRILKAVEKEFALTMPDVEISYLLLHIKGAKIRYSDTEAQSFPSGFDEASLFDLIDSMIEAFDPRQADSLRRDEEFVRGLFVHLQPTIVRLKNHLNIINPLLADIKSEYTDVFENVRRAAAVLSKALDTPVSEEEIGYLTMHFGAALERRKGSITEARRVSIGVVCASGFGLARLMMTRLKNKLPLSVDLHTYGKDELTPQVLKETDFFVSSLPLNIEKADVLRISPLMTPSELQRINIKIEEYAHLRKPRAAASAQDEDFLSVLDKTHLIAREMAVILRQYRHYTVPASATFAQVVHTLAESAVSQEADTALLFDAIIRRERLNSQIFPDQGFALLHCRTDTVRQALFLTCSPAAGPFTNAYFHGIRTVLLLLMPNDEYRQVHTDVLGYISSSLINDDAFYQAVLNQDAKKIRCHLQRILKTYFESVLGL
ncbi:MAG: BglG family transcription antiterminator [Megasphaera sp.]|uniref:BglG family transcription antiterminator n=1 Tax=Megasphaera sp. TaxID=2023260 RepID=UPI0025D34C0B|nr:BglG family transcription antiterminator [uncultured Megasphaera sp.]